MALGVAARAAAVASWPVRIHSGDGCSGFLRMLAAEKEKEAYEAVSRVEEVEEAEVAVDEKRCEKDFISIF